MKIFQYCSAVAILFSAVVLFCKICFDIYFFELFQELDRSEGVIPGVVSGNIRVLLPLLLPSFVLSIVGVIKKNRYSWFALGLTVFVFFYILTPVAALVFFYFK